MWLTSMYVPVFEDEPFATLAQAATNDATDQVIYLNESGQAEKFVVGLNYYIFGGSNGRDWITVKAVDAVNNTITVDGISYDLNDFLAKRCLVL